MKREYNHAFDNRYYWENIRQDVDYLFAFARIPCGDSTEPFGLERLDLSSSIGLMAERLAEVLPQG